MPLRHLPIRFVDSLKLQAKRPVAFMLGKKDEEVRFALLLNHSTGG